MLRFPERAVQVVLANRAQLDYLIDASDDVAEFRLAKEVATFFMELENRDQLERVRELLARSIINEDRDVVVTILDSGVNNGHLLIKPFLEDGDLHTLNPEWGTYDDRGHGTLMAGIALYGDLLEVLSSGAPVESYTVLNRSRFCRRQTKIPVGYGDTTPRRGSAGCAFRRRIANAFCAWQSHR